jgi:TPP-dependent trihydroxycyclohexane-1,2-dione (THcHDO) dehydratase
MIDSNFKFYKQITDNPQFNQIFVDWLFERYVTRTTNATTAYPPEESLNQELIQKVKKARNDIAKGGGIRYNSAQDLFKDVEE